MQFERNGHNDIDNPTEVQLLKGLEDLGNHYDDFAILAIDNMTYLQVANGDEDGFILEYQNGSLAEHYIAENTDIPEEDILRAFVSYLKGDNAWKEAFEWEKMEM